MAFSARTAKVVLNGREATALSAVQQEIEQAGGKAMSVVADVTKFAELEDMCGKVERAFGPVDILMANAGGSSVRPAPLEEIREKVGALRSTPISPRLF